MNKNQLLFLFSVWSGSTLIPKEITKKIEEGYLKEQPFLILRSAVMKNNHFLFS
ncbi:hypothetical protein [Polaribacter sp.]|uniref:hypothetical protein n=1 Tax=Polaribacter sp. TaxID=1920175 RepID=UPI003F4C87AA